MGQKPSYQKATQDEVNFSSEPPPASLRFDSSESYVVSYGIDVQTNHKFSPDMNLSSVTVDDAKKVRDVLVQSGTIPSSNARLYAASDNPELCKMKGMKKTFQECARKVGASGLFVFHFSGHGVKMRRKSEWGLAPVDFDYSKNMYLTADVLDQWFREAECKAKHILLFLDCCHAGGVAAKLCKFADLPVRGNLYVLSACTANEETLVIGALKHSIFTYFLSLAIVKLCKTPGEFPLQAIFNECHTCSKAFSSLMVMYNMVNDTVTVKCMQPQMAVINPKHVMDGVSEGQSRIQSDGEVNRFQYAMELWDCKKPILWLDEKTIAHISSWVSPNGALCELDKRKLLDGRVLEAAVCSMMYSVAVIELSCDRSQVRVKNTNLSIVAFHQVAAALDTVVEDLHISQPLFFMAWMVYREALRSNGVNISGFRKLCRQLSNDTAFYPDITHRIRTATIVPSYKPVLTSEGQGAGNSRVSGVCVCVCVCEEGYIYCKL